MTPSSSPGRLILRPMIIDEATPVYLLTFLFGAVIGSFLNVCIHRIPSGISIVTPPSSCPNCGKHISFYDNIPVLSYMILGGRCRKCKTSISFRYPFVEVLNGGLWTALMWRFDFQWSTVVYAVLVSSLLVITFIDLDHQIIPDRISIPGIPIGMLLGSLILIDPFLRTSALGWENSLIGAVLGFGLFYAIAVLSRGGMGGGDIKLMGMLGGFIGWKGVLLTTFFGSLFGSVVGLFLVVFKGGGRKSKVPFGPFLAGGALLSLFFGQEILGWYLSYGWR